MGDMKFGRPFSTSRPFGGIPEASIPRSNPLDANDVPSPSLDFSARPTAVTVRMERPFALGQVPLPSVEPSVEEPPVSPLPSPLPLLSVA